MTERRSSEPRTEEGIRVTLITSNYPYERHPNVGTFVASLANQWAKQGAIVDVIAPLPIYSGQTKQWILRHRSSSGECLPTVHRPTYVSFSGVRVGPISTHQWTTHSFERAVRRANQRAWELPHVVYSHFLYPAGWAGLRLARRLGCPAVVALGESSFDYAEAMQGRSQIAEAISGFDGILCVSGENAGIVRDRYGANPDKVVVVPNAVNTDRFQPRNRAEMRRKHGLPQDKTILSFVGHFIDRKGPLRVLEAMEGVEGLYGVFLGEGPQWPSGPRVLHAGPVPHEEVAEWLSATDFFSLPTLAEGSPNAVLEAMACGLPVVSSDIPSLAETVDDRSAILVSPKDVTALREAFQVLVSASSRRKSMSVAALERGTRTNLEGRASRILSWISREVVNDRVELNRLNHLV